MRCQEKLAERLNLSGYTAFRLGIQSMHSISPTNDGSLKLIQNLKQWADPNNILAPGRYEFNSQRTNYFSANAVGE